MTDVNSTELDKDIQARHESEDHYGFNVWVAGHRNGQSGLDNPNTDDIASKCLIRST